MPYSIVSFRMTLRDLQKIFNNTKRRAVSLRQLSFLFRGRTTDDGPTMVTIAHLALKAAGNVYM